MESALKTTPNFDQPWGISKMITFIEINVPSSIPGERRARLRVDKITDLRDDFMSDGKGKEKTPVLRIIMEGGANVVAHQETIDSFFERLQAAYSQGIVIIEAPKIIVE